MNWNLILPFALLFSSALAFGTNCGGNPTFTFNGTLTPQAVPQNLKVAFFGDQGLGSNPKSVLEMIKAWGAEFIVHSGDFDYTSSPSSWFSLIDSVLGPSYPYFASIGNHDVTAWDGYYTRLVSRYSAMGAAQYCVGELGVNMVCNYKGLLIVYSGIGTKGNNHVQFIDSSFKSDLSAVWKICSWHKNQRLYQTGDKSDETGYAVYDKCREYGAIVATAHEHSYSRTYLMTDFATQKIANTIKSPLSITPGKSFAFVSGVGGSSLRAWKNNLEKNPWWASVASTDNGLNYGALLCTFNVNGQTNKAICEQRDIKGKVWDQFEILSTPSPIQGLKSECNDDWIDLQVSSSNDDLSEDLSTGEIFKSKSHIHVASKKSNLLNAIRFERIPLNQESKIKHIYLQLMGAKEGEGKAWIQINAELAPNSMEFSGNLSREISVRQKTKNYVEWTEFDGDLEGWEKREIWISPDLKDIVKEVVSQQGWEHNNSITFFLKGTGNREVYSFDQDRCVAPSLVIEMEC